VKLNSIFLVLILSPVFSNDVINIQGGDFSCRIERDHWGVPHIYGKTDADVAFGLAYAHAQDDFFTIQDILIAARGKLASVYGKDAAVNDYYVHMMDIWNNVNQNYEAEVPLDIRNICDGYAQGINLFLKDNPKLGNDNFDSITGRDLIAGFSHRLPLMFGLDGIIKKLSKGNPKDQIGWNNENFNSNSYKMIASNVFSIAPQRSDDGYTRLWINSHQPWDGPVAWYEAHLVSEDGWDFYAGIFPGSPIPLIGHNTDLGWGHTVNEPDLVDIYELIINSKNKDQYWFEGEWHNFHIRDAPIRVKLFGPFYWTFNRIVKESIHGPVLEFDHGSYALRISSSKDLRFVEQWYRMSKAKNIDDFTNAMRIHALPMFNTAYADKEGNIFYVYNAKIPKRNENYKWDTFLKGDIKSNIWSEYIPFDSLPQILNPNGGFIQNCNSNPYLATGLEEDILNRLPVWAGIETHQTNRAFRALETFGSDSLISKQEFFNYKYDVVYSENSNLAKIRDRFINDIKNIDIPKLEPAFKLIEDWNLSADLENHSAAICMIVLPNAFNISDLDYDKNEIVKKLSETVDYFIQKFGKIDVPLGEVIRLVRGETNLPLSGGPDLLRAIYFEKKNDIYMGIGGDSYFQAVEWSPKGELNAWSIHQYGSTTLNKHSKHYDDQAKLFSKQKMKQIRP